MKSIIKKCRILLPTGVAWEGNLKIATAIPANHENQNPFLEICQTQGQLELELIYNSRFSLYASASSSSSKAIFEVMMDPLVALTSSSIKPRFGVKVGSLTVGYGFPGLQLTFHSNASHPRSRIFQEVQKSVIFGFAEPRGDDVATVLDVFMGFSGTNHQKQEVDESFLRGLQLGHTLGYKDGLKASELRGGADSSSASPLNQKVYHGVAVPQPPFYPHFNTNDANPWIFLAGVLLAVTVLFRFLRNGGVVKKSNNINNCERKKSFLLLLSQFYGFTHNEIFNSSWGNLEN